MYNYENYSELITSLHVVEQHNELLMKNHQSTSNDSNHGRGRGRGHGHKPYGNAYFSPNYMNHETSSEEG